MHLHIELDNDAFAGDECGPEIARILGVLTARIVHMSRRDMEDHNLIPRDYNGNCVGTVDFEIDDNTDTDEGEDE